MSALKTIVIVGGGTAGWMTAAALAKVVNGGKNGAKNGQYAIKLVESEEIGTVGVGESTIPAIRLFNQLLGVDENTFMRETQATFKLGIELCDWGAIGDRYLHAFGRIGHAALLPFHHYWLRMQQAGRAPDLWAYSINAAAARAQCFMRADPGIGNSPLAEIVHAFHIDAGLYARFLRRFAEGLGVQRIEARVQDALLHPDNGHVRALRLASGDLVEGDLFIDCSGFRGLLIEQTLHTGYESWSHWLPCDRAVVVPSERVASVLPPFTRATARPAGWQWRIGLQQRTGNGHVYASAAMSDDEAASLLMRNLDAAPLAEPRVLHFTSGRRRKVWHRNVVAIGLSAGFMEPLESTAIHLVQSTIARLIQFFPDAGFNPVEIAEFNRQCDFESERIRDFLILHYHATTRSDTAFWDHCRTMEVPATLQDKLDLYRAGGRIVRHNDELFSEVGWLQVLHGQGITPCTHHPLADAMDEKELADYLHETQAVIGRCVAQMPSHADYIAQQCAT